jgi:hypothetical protein
MPSFIGSLNARRGNAEQEFSGVRLHLSNQIFIQEKAVETTKQKGGFPFTTEDGFRPISFLSFH